MKYSIMGFNQDKIINETNLDLSDLLLVDYIVRAQGMPTMKHITENEESYVWLSHEKLQEDLPILNISEGTLKNRLSTLKKEGIIKSKQVANNESRGTRTYYAITEKTMSLLYDEESTTTSRKNDVVTRPGHFKMTSDNILTSNINNLSKDKLLPEKSKRKKKSLYQQCYDEILNYFNDEVLVNKIDEFLRLCLKEKWIQYKPQWIYKLKDLENIKGDKLQSVEQTLRKGWKSFYEPENSTKSKFTDVQQHSERVREEDIVDAEF